MNYIPASNIFGERFLILFFPKFTLKKDGLFHKGRLVRWEDITRITYFNQRSGGFHFRGMPTRGAFSLLTVYYPGGSIPISQSILDRGDYWFSTSYKSEAFEFLHELLTRKYKGLIETSADFPHTVWFKNLMSGAALLILGFLFLFGLIILWVFLELN